TTKSCSMTLPTGPIGVSSSMTFWPRGPRPGIAECAYGPREACSGLPAGQCGPHDLPGPSIVRSGGAALVRADLLPDGAGGHRSGRRGTRPPRTHCLRTQPRGNAHPRGHHSRFGIVTKVRERLAEPPARWVLVVMTIPGAAEALAN